MLQCLILTQRTRDPGANCKGGKGKNALQLALLQLGKECRDYQDFSLVPVPRRPFENAHSIMHSPGDVVLVLFGGSGSEIVECKRMKRHFISAEIDKTYYELISKRLQLGGDVPKEYRLISKMKSNLKLRNGG